MELLVCFGKTPRLWIFSNLPVVAAYTRSALEKRHLLKIPTTGIPYSLRSPEVLYSKDEQPELISEIQIRVCG